MRTLIYLATALAVMGLAFWAYRVNYETQDRLGDLRTINREIASLHEGLGVLGAEWAYLNRPDRLRELVNMNFTRVPLLPLAPEQFGTAAQVAYPAPEVADDLPLGEPIDVIATGIDANTPANAPAVEEGQ